MAIYLDFSGAASQQIEQALCERLDQIRLARNVTQKQLAEQAGVSPRTIARLVKGDGVSLDTFIRVMMALRIQQNLEALLPDPSVRPIERIDRGGRERQRARPDTAEIDTGDWEWDDD